ncbi:XRE family transcriptional regulator [Pedobacter jeongneungensis]|uniref:XRE family transcriptional regulator n=1 Tax=Pedobacter jeongneungensis TaxID=947309 RepID=UPI0004A797F5|nr:helix-turn-helix domain-containing protein [Pedobacter jeongneungensis]
MNNQKVFFGSNIKFLRNRRKLSQESVAGALEIKRAKLSAIENGMTQMPAPEDVINFSNYFKVSIDSLFKVDLSKLGELKLRELEAGNDVYMNGSKIRVLAISVDKNNKENLEYVPVKAKAGYRSGFNDPDYIATLPKFSLPSLPKGKTFRMFPTTGDSMLPFPDGCDIVCQYIEDWGSLKPQTLCIAILQGEQDFVFKRVTVQTDGLLMESLNPVYKPYVVPIPDVLELWQYYSYHTRDIPEAQDIQSIASMVRKIHADIKALQAKT